MTASFGVDMGYLLSRVCFVRQEVLPRRGTLNSTPAQMPCDGLHSASGIVVRQAAI
ncbi:hypothetical protein GCM10023209_26900 [Roseibacterium beibuensis]|uniref:Uncharacterized protein n=1 Tax=[Roseibacterium] beibuensis TaxID=1193142 RepID=A0ABP9LJ31_9RHOB